MHKEETESVAVSHDTIMAGQQDLRHLIERHQDQTNAALADVRAVAEKGVAASHANTVTLAEISGQLKALQDYRTTGNEWSTRVDARLAFLELEQAKVASASNTYSGIFRHPVVVQILMQVITLVGLITYLQEFGVKAG